MARKTPNIELPPDKERLVDQKKRQPYGVRSEEELIKKLFEEQNSSQEDDVEEFLTEKVNVHKARPNEE